MSNKTKRVLKRKWRGFVKWDLPVLVNGLILMLIVLIVLMDSFGIWNIFR